MICSLSLFDHPVAIYKVAIPISILSIVSNPKLISLFWIIKVVLDISFAIDRGTALKQTKPPFIKAKSRRVQN